MVFYPSRSRLWELALNNLLKGTPKVGGGFITIIFIISEDKWMHSIHLEN